MNNREGQVFWFKTNKHKPNALNVFLIVGRTFHEESIQDVWRVVELETGEESCFSEDFLRIKEASSRFA